MRIGSVSALALAALGLAACEGVPTTGSSASNATLNLCGLNCPDPAVDGDDSTPPATPSDPNDPDNTNVGNPTQLNSGDTTIVLESAVLKSPQGGSLSRLTRTSNAPPVLDTARIEIDTNTANNSNWPIPKTMDEYEYGTNASGGVGLGGAYKEYRSIDVDTSGTTRDEDLQVWSWGNSYATQYREEGGGGDARRQAWSFGGTRTTNMPTTASATYTGEYGATSKTWNWVESSDPGKTIKENNIWRVQGTSSITADFGNSQLTGTLRPQTWTAWQTENGASGFASVGANNTLDPNHTGFMNEDVIIQGTITGNTVSGKASLDPSNGWVNGSNPMYAGFFGTGAAEVTGAYAFTAVSPDPVGGEPPHNDPRRGFVQQSGVFHAE